MAVRLIAKTDTKETEIKCGIMINLDYEKEEADYTYVGMDIVDLTNAISILTEILDSHIRENHLDEMFETGNILSGRGAMAVNGFERYIESE